MVKPLAERLSAIIVDERDPDWGEMRDLDIAAAKKAYEADLLKEQMTGQVAEQVAMTMANANTPANAEWAVENGWMAHDSPAIAAVLGEAAAYDWDSAVTSQILDEERVSARQTVTASRLGAEALHRM